MDSSMIRESSSLIHWTVLRMWVIFCDMDDSYDSTPCVNKLKFIKFAGYLLQKQSYHMKAEWILFYSNIVWYWWHNLKIVELCNFSDVLSNIRYQNTGLFFWNYLFYFRILYFRLYSIHAFNKKILYYWHINP